MAGETIKSSAICLDIHPWSRTSHIVKWLTPSGIVPTIVKGAVRPKSSFLGQYDLNYTCDILYYARSHAELHALRECTAVNRRDELRKSFRILALADYFRCLAANLTPNGPDARKWFQLVASALDSLTAPPADRTADPRPHHLARLLSFELATLDIAGLTPEFTDENGVFCLHGERSIPLSAEVQRCLANPLAEKNLKILVDSARVIGVYYSFHLDCAPDVRRTVLRMIL